MAFFKDIVTTILNLSDSKWPKVNFKFEPRSNGIIVKPEFKGHWPSDEILASIFFSVPSVDLNMHAEHTIRKDALNQITITYPNGNCPEQLEKEVGKELDINQVNWLCFLSLGYAGFNPLSTNTQYSTKDRPSSIYYFRCLWKYSRKTFMTASMLIFTEIISFLLLVYFLLHWRFSLSDLIKR